MNFSGPDLPPLDTGQLVAKKRRKEKKKKSS